MVTNQDRLRRMKTIAGLEEEPRLVLASVYSDLKRYGWGLPDLLCQSAILASIQQDRETMQTWLDNLTLDSFVIPYTPGDDW